MSVHIESEGVKPSQHHPRQQTHWKALWGRLPPQSRSSGSLQRKCWKWSDFSFLVYMLNFSFGWCNICPVAKVWAAGCKYFEWSVWIFISSHRSSECWEVCPALTDTFFSEQLRPRSARSSRRRCSSTASSSPGRRPSNLTVSSRNMSSNTTKR